MNPALRLRIPLAVALLAAALAPAGCGYFRPTQPAPPSGDGVPQNYDTPLLTLTTLELAIVDKAASNGRDAYLGGIANADDGQDFTTTFDPATVSRFPGESTNWSSAREAEFYSNLSVYLTTSTFLFTWGVDPTAPDDAPDETPAIFYRSYHLRASADGGNTYTTASKGNAELHFIKSGTDWKLVRWIDHEDPTANRQIGEVCFGELRLSGP